MKDIEKDGFVVRLKQKKLDGEKLIIVTKFINKIKA
jgi:hypothetical protein